MIMLLTACGAKEDNTKQEDEVTVDEGTETESTTEDNAETDVTTDESTETEVEFDKNWASAEAEILIPEPPFAYEVEMEDRGSEIVFEIKATNGGENGDVTHEGILAYCEDLKNVGFSESIREGEIGERYGRTCYEFYAENGNRSAVNLIDDGAGVMILAIISTE